jgi:hypothetical protein
MTDQDAELDCLLARSGVAIRAPGEAASMRAAFAELRAQVALLRQPRTVAAEPANVFRLLP